MRPRPNATPRESPGVRNYDSSLPNRAAAYWAEWFRALDKPSPENLDRYQLQVRIAEQCDYVGSLLRNVTS